jgi:hypothetical protein
LFLNEIPRLVEQSLSGQSTRQFVEAQ